MSSSSFNDFKFKIDDIDHSGPWDIYRSYDWDSSVIGWKPPLPNPKMIFHNKLPKSGSSTMNNLLKVLSKSNQFAYKKIEPTDLPNDLMSEESPVINWIKANATGQPFVLLKHHFPFDFTKHSLEQPTYINVIRDPIDWFQSHYYFERFGWEQVNGARHFKGTEEDKNMIIDDCVKNKHKQCVNVPWRYMEYFCGNGPECNPTTSGKPAQVAETTKLRMMTTFYVIGVLEQWENTLDLFQVINRFKQFFYFKLIFIHSSFINCSNVT